MINQNSEYKNYNSINLNNKFDNSNQIYDIYDKIRIVESEYKNMNLSFIINNN